MPDIFSLFDGKMSSGAGAAVEAQTQDSLSDISSENDLLARLASGSDMVDLAVDYSDFANFVTFNSAESYVNTTADQILNEYPIGGTVDDLQGFTDSLDGYQRYFLRHWPSRTGKLLLGAAHSSSYVRFDDFGVQDGAARSSFVSPGTGSLSIQGWIGAAPYISGSQTPIIFQKLRAGTDDGITVFLSGTGVAHLSQLYVRVTSGSVTSEVSGNLSEYYPNFFAAVLDRGSSTGTLSLYSALSGTFPTLSGSSPVVLGSRFDLASGSFYIGSGSLPSKVTQLYQGSVDDFSIWSTVRDSAVLTGTFNRKIYAQSGLLGAWRFSEATSNTPSSYASIVRDCSGHRLDGRIQNYYWGCRESGSLTNDVPDPILTLEDPDVVSYVVTAQVSGSSYDRQNSSLIYNLFPQEFSRDSDSFKNFSLIIARFFDRIKLYIKQLPNLRRIDYSSFDNAPDDLLEDVGALLGWQLDGSFATTDALKYFVGRDVSVGTAANVSQDTKMSDIKSRFWRRVLQNLMYLYKTKGTRESVEALLRVYGVDNGFVRLKEYSRKTESRLPVNRVQSEKSVYTLPFSGSYLDPVNSIVTVSPQVRPSNSGTFQIGTSGSFTAEVRVRFPTTSSDDLHPSKVSGSIFVLATGSSAPLILRYEKNSVASKTGSLFLTSSAGRLTLPSASIFTDNFYNISVVRETTTGSLTISVLRYENDQLVYSTSSSGLTGTVGVVGPQVYDNFYIGSWTGSVAGTTAGEFWAQEFRLWDADLVASELDDHARNFESYGREISYKNSDLKVHWRLAQLFDVSSLAKITVSGSTPIPVNGIGSDFPTTPSTVGKKFLLDYSYIPSIDYGWNQEKVRVYDGTSIDARDRYEDERFVSLEFNMFDALNEDISHLMASYDELNNILGHPMNRYRRDYEGLQQMRETYFKRLQGQLNFKVFVDMLDFFDSTFVTIVQRLIPARSIFKGDEIVVESHMLERPKYAYGFRPIREGILDISGSISIVDRNEDWT